MTSLEAIEAAGRVWGRARVSLVRQTPTGWDVHLLPGHSLTAPYRALASDTRDRWDVVHTIDETGRPTCHDDCKGLGA